jgi:hypothetical protein
MKHGKKSLAIVLSLASILFLSACNGHGGPGNQRSLYERGLSIVSLMDELAGEPLTTSPELISALSAIEQGDHSVPKAVYKITVSDENLLFLMASQGIQGNSDRVKQYIKQRALSAIISRLNSEAGTTALAASSVCSATEAFVYNDLSENAIYLYTFEDAVPAAVTFIKGVDGAVTATGSFLLNNSHSYDSEQEIKELFDFVSADVVTLPVK